MGCCVTSTRRPHRSSRLLPRPSSASTISAALRLAAADRHWPQVETLAAVAIPLMPLAHAIEMNALTLDDAAGARLQRPGHGGRIF